MKAIVKTEFKGQPEGEPRARPILPGEELDGDLAKVAVSEGWADPVGAKKPAEKAAKPARNKAHKAAPRNKSGS